MSAITNETVASDKARLHAPKGFWSLTFTEFWERFSYYGLQGILTFYLIYSVVEGGLGLTPLVAIGIVGTYGGAVYLAQVVGAWIADRILAPRTTILVGGIVIMLGHIALAVFPGIVGLVFGLACIAIGTGLLKTNVSATIGVLFDKRPRTDQDAAFSYFYLGINMGAIAGPLLTGLLQSSIGFHIAFGLAAVGMAFGLTQYAMCYCDLPEETRIVKNPAPIRTRVTASAGAVIMFTAIAALIATGVVRQENLSLLMGCIILLVVIAYFAQILRSKDVTSAEKRRVRGYIPLWVAETIYYGFLLQIFTTIPLLVADRVDRNVGGFMVPEGWFSFIGTIAFVLALWLIASRWKESRVAELPPTTKFALGLLTVSLGYLLLLFTEPIPGRTISPFFIAVCLIVAGVSEIFTGPIGMSLVTRIAPDGFRARLVGVKILTLGAGSTVASFFGGLYIKMSFPAFILIISAIGLLSAALLQSFSRRIEQQFT
ncbi:peptide MFS transporter [Rhodococcus sp. NPDC060176]|uniref:peptide MFS transporter n=1 Tax=Rhodococcus sp. NPDC060176 TaxID=3347062 RepID=UPI0036660336